MASGVGGPAHQVNPSGALASTDKLIVKKAPPLPRLKRYFALEIAARDKNPFKPCQTNQIPL